MNRIINHTFLVVKRCFSMRKFSHVLYDVVLLYFHRFLCKRKNAQLAKKKVLPACLSLNYNFFAYIMSETQWRRKNLHPTRNSSVVLKRLCAGALIGLTTITHMPSTWIFFARIDSWVIAYSSTMFKFKSWTKVSVILTIGFVILRNFLVQLWQIWIHLQKFKFKFNWTWTISVFA